MAFTLRLDEKTDRNLEVIAFLEKRTKTDIIKEAVERYIKKYGPVEDPRK